MTDDGDRARPLAPAARALLLLVGLAAFAGFVALGIWQVHRLSWKLKLIAQVEQRLAAAPGPAPGPSEWAGITKDSAYLRVTVQGQFDHARETCTQAVTELGPGCWVMTPLQTDAGWWLLVNRGFVDEAHRVAASRADAQLSGHIIVTGLLRLSEPGGGFFRRNDPAIGRWTSRDVAAIASARGLAGQAVAPYFVDAADTVSGGPVGGLTVVRFHNSHLVYALTWFALAGLVLFACVQVVRRERRLIRARS